MEANLYVKFYTSAAKKQNMWIEQEGEEGMRYEVSNMEEIKSSFQDYIEKHIDSSDFEKADKQQNHFSELEVGYE